MAAHTWHLVLESAAAVVLALWGGILMARAPRPWVGPSSPIVSPRSSVAALRAIAGPAMVSAGVIHASAGGGTGVAALAVLQFAAGASLFVSPRSAALVAIAAVAGLAGWVWSATLGSGAHGHNALEMPALATVALEALALAAAVALSLRPRRTGQLGRHSTLLWGIAIPTVGIGALLVLLALTNGVHPAHELLLPASRL